MIIIQERWREDKYVSKPLQNDRPGKSVADPGSGLKQKQMIYYPFTLAASIYWL